MIRVDPSPILCYFYFFIRSELVRVDPTRTGGPSWSGPTFVPASCNLQAKKVSEQTRTKTEQNDSIRMKLFIQLFHF